jgi:hypothetical protein
MYVGLSHRERAHAYFVRFSWKGEGVLPYAPTGSDLQSAVMAADS